MEIFPTLGPYWELGPPCLLIFANINFSTCKIVKYTLSIKGILTTFCVSEVCSRRKSTKLALPPLRLLNFQDFYHHPLLFGPLPPRLLGTVEYLLKETLRRTQIMSKQ